MTPSLLDQSPEDSRPTNTGTLPPPASWPTPPDPAIYHELLGEIVNTIAPHTEADPVAILTQLLLAFGAAVGRGAFFQVEATRHHPNEFMLLVGDSSRARKGSSWDHVRRLLAKIDPSIEPRILTGLSSGEGLIWAVRDPTAQDPGHSDQRLLVIEPEFASVLKAASREISTLSPTLRSAWDGRPLAILTRTAPARATSAHIAVIGHITQDELRRHTTTVELANGYLNRILLVACRRHGCCPKAATRTRSAAPASPGCSPRPSSTPRQRARSASTPTPASSGITPTDNSPNRRPGIVGQITARAEAHTIRLALLYTLADGQRQISPPAPHRRARAPRLRRPLRRLGTDRRDRPATRRADPRRAPPQSEPA